MISHHLVDMEGCSRRQAQHYRKSDLQTPSLGSGREADSLCHSTKLSDWSVELKLIRQVVWHT